jgi:hypothetical protein
MSQPKDTVEISLTELKALIDCADKALNGDSNDDEHDALYEIREMLADWTNQYPIYEEVRSGCGCQLGLTRERTMLLTHCPLHAAAPKLLATLERLLTLYEDTRVEIERARAAIARAKGENNG